MTFHLDIPMNCKSPCRLRDDLHKAVFLEVALFALDFLLACTLLEGSLHRAYVTDVDEASGAD